MFLLFDKRFQPILTNDLGIPSDKIFEMQYAYMDTMQKLQINEGLVYIDEKNLMTEGEYIDQLTDTSLPKEEQLQNLEKLYTYSFELAQNHPELAERIQAKVTELHRGILDNILERLSEEAIQAVMQMFIEDINAIYEMSDRFEELELPQRLKNFTPE